MRFLAVPVALTAGLLIASPALANDACATTPAQLRSVAATADVATAKKALGYVSIGEKLCAAGNERAASKKFAAAMKMLNVDSAALTSVAAAK